ncbi:MAG: T9SS type A sorting domain-containing protein [Bacteroidales bacterium]|nr:T9SS type A sorting domain-containing protein [Bacteroidales bacterium]
MNFIRFVMPVGTRILGIAVTEDFPPSKPGCKYGVYVWRENGVDTLETVDVNGWCKKMRYMYQGYDSSSMAVPCYIYLFGEDVYVEATATQDTFYIAMDDGGGYRWAWADDLEEYGALSPYYLISDDYKRHSDGYANICPNIESLGSCVLGWSNNSLGYPAYTAAWGLYFPILQLPCPLPSKPWVADRLAEGVLFQWPLNDSLDHYEVSLSLYGSDSTVYHSGLLSDASFLLSDSLMASLGLSEDNYSLRFRKECVFESGSYRTSTWSEWSAPRPFHYATAAGIADVAMPVLTLVPNPASGRVTLTLSEAPEGGGTLAVVDVEGRQVLSMPMAAGATTATFDVSALPSGVYFVRLATASGVCSQRLLVEP